MKTLYVTDLDGTLLQPNERLSAFAVEKLTQLAEKGILFSYATARSIHSASVCTEGLKAKIPLILHNGVFIMDNRSWEILHKECFDGQLAKDIYRVLQKYAVSPIVYALIDGAERFSYDDETISPFMRSFIATRWKDRRRRTLSGNAAIMEGEVYYFTCIELAEKLLPAKEELEALYGDRLNLIYQKDLYSGDQWLEIIPKNATKATAIQKLKEMTGADKVVAFGDGINDIPMFLEADLALAVENAHPDLKAAADGVIGPNTGDGVVRWLLENAE